MVGGESGERRIGARKGVVLACGGFEWNAEMVKAFIGYEVKPLSPWTNTGDGHQMAMEVGAKMGGMTGFFSYGVMYDPWEKGRDGNPLPQMMMGLGAGSIIVNQQGRRFMHGGYTYNDFSHPFGVLRPAQPRVLQQGTRLGRLRCQAPGERASWGPSRASSSTWSDRMVKPPPTGWCWPSSVRELAEKMGVDPQTLEETVTRYNEYAEKGEDPDWGDPTQTNVLTGPDTVNLKPILGPPFGAIQQWPGTIGTNGGCRIDADARVLGHRTADRRWAVRGGQHLRLGARPHLPGRRFLHRSERHDGLPGRAPRGGTAVSRHRRLTAPGLRARSHHDLGAKRALRRLGARPDGPRQGARPDRAQPTGQSVQR